MTPSLSHYNLIVVGRRIVSDGLDYYMNTQQLQFLKELVAPFDTAVYLSYIDLETAVDSDALEKIDQSVIEVQGNHVFEQSDNVLRKVSSIRSDIRNLRRIEQPCVTYIFFPGVYSFLLAPFVLRVGTVNTVYFGNEAVDEATNKNIGPILNRIKFQLYHHGQTYVLNTADVSFIRDPRMLDFEVNSEIIESKPITKFDESLTPDDTGAERDIEEPIRLLCVGAFRPVKGHRYLLEAFEELESRSDFQFDLSLVGDGTERMDLEAMADHLGIEDSVTFTGYIDDTDTLHEQYEEADIFVLPSLTEGFPRVLNEAMAFRLPIVATHVGGIPRVLDDGTHAILVDPEEPGAIVQAVESLVHNRELRQRLVANAAQRAGDYLGGSPGKQHLTAVRKHL